MATPLAEQLTETDAERRALASVRDATGEVNGGMERHGVRCFLLCELLAERHSVALDREVILCAALVHDLGLYPSVSKGGVYTEEGGDLARELALEAGWDAERAEVCAQACTHHHALTSQWGRGAEVELLRLADRIEVSAGLVRSGLTRAEVREVFDAAPRDGFYGEVAHLLARALRERPLSLPRIFR